MTTENATITIEANGEPFAVHGGTSLVQFIEHLGLSPLHVVVEHNGRPVPRDEIARITLADGDRLEILRIVAGG